jgi:hypothetical protein
MQKMAIPSLSYEPATDLQFELELALTKIPEPDSNLSEHVSRKTRQPSQYRYYLKSRYRYLVLEHHAILISRKGKKTIKNSKKYFTSQILNYLCFSHEILKMFSFATLMK